MILVSEFFRYLLKPRLLKISRRQSLSEVVQLHVFILFFFFANVLLLGILGSFIDLASLPNRLESDPSFSGPISMTLLAVVLAPIGEELIFRAPLRQGILAIPSYIGYIIILIVAIIVWSMGYTDFDLWQIGIPLLLVLLLSTLLLKSRAKRIINVSYRSIFPAVFYVQALLFSFVHIFNYELSAFPNYYILPLLVLPQLFIGLALGFIRIKYGLLQSIYVHAMYNGVLVSLANFQGGGM